MVRISKHNRTERYAHTGGFNRLAGRPSAPGSWRSEAMCRKWKLLYWGLCLAFLAVGLHYCLF